MELLVWHNHSNFVKYFNIILLPLFSSVGDDIIQKFNPFGVYTIEKLKMFGIPSDQRLTASQILELYKIMSNVDERVK